MWNHLRSEAGQSALAGQDSSREISDAWNNVNQNKAALRHIENHLEAAPGSGVLLDSVLDPQKTAGSRRRKTGHRDGHRVEKSESRPRSRCSPGKGSRSPLRTSMLDINTQRTSAVEFREPVASYREASPLATPQTQSESDVLVLPSDMGVSYPQFTLSQPLYQGDPSDFNCTHSPAVDGTTSARYLNNLSALSGLHQLDLSASGSEVKPKTHLQVEASYTSTLSSPGSVSASERMENQRQRQPIEKLEKLKERIRRQREHLEETSDRKKLLGYLEQPVGFGEVGHRTTAPTVKVRKVAQAPPAPIYKGFNTSETKIRTPDVKVWAEEQFQNLSREIYRDLTQQLTAGSPKPKRRPAERERKETKPSKPVRKVHRCSSAPESSAKAVTSTSAWREGQKLVKMMLGPSPRIRSEPRAQSSTDPVPRSASNPRLERNRRSRPKSAERPRDHVPPVEPAGSSRPAREVRGKTPRSERLSADIRDLLEDLQLEEGSCREVPATSKVRSSTRVSRSASPAKTVEPSDKNVPKKRHYDAEAVRAYITQKQEERKKRQAEERKAQREEEERRNKRLQELYRRQRAGAARGPTAPEGQIKKRLQETYTKLLEQTHLTAEISAAVATDTVPQVQQRAAYQPSGDSDKENKRHEGAQSSTSSSDLSLTEQSQPPLSRNELEFAGSSCLQSDRHSPAVMSGSNSLAPPSGCIFSQLLELDSEASGQERFRAAAAGFSSDVGRKLSRIEALKATAASLSSRIESEARKLAGAGINYGCARDMGTGLPVPPENCWADPVSPPVRENPTGPDDLVERIQRLLAAGQSTYEDVLPGVGNLHSFREKTVNKPNVPPAASKNTRKISSPPEPNKPDPLEVALDSSGGSISEGPLLSEGSLSEDDEDMQELSKSSHRPGATVHSTALTNGDVLNPISRFQKEAEKQRPFSRSRLVRETMGPWEELAKGSPNSVINIFTKNMQRVKERVGTSSPALQSVLLAATSLDEMAYEDDFISSRCSSQSASKRSFNGLSSNGHDRFSPPEEKLSVGSACEKRDRSHGSSVLTPLSSPHSTSSGSRRASELSLQQEQKNTSSAVSDLPDEGSRRNGWEKASSRASSRSVDTESTLGGVSARSVHSLGSEGKNSPRSLCTTSAAGSPACSGSSRLSAGDVTPVRGSDQRSSPPHNVLPGSSSSSSAGRVKSKPSPRTQSRRAEHTTAAPAELQFAPAILQQRLSAELSFLDAVEESVRQLGDVERVRGISLAQQETVSLAQILKSQQQRHERELHLLKMKAEQEALETQRQLEESRQKAAQTHAELQDSLLRSQQQVLGDLHESTNKMIQQQAEAARHTAETARHIKEMTELARSQIAGALSVPGSSSKSLYDQQTHHSHAPKRLQPRPHTDSSWTSEQSPDRAQTDAEKPDSLSDSIPSRRPTISGGGSSISQPSPSHSDQKKKKKRETDRSNSSVEDLAHTAVDDSLRSDSVPEEHSLLQQKADSASIDTEYSVKFDSITEDDTEEKSLRSLLSSEAHRRQSLDRKSSPRPESDDDHSHERSSPRERSKQDGSVIFSSAQDGFSKFTLDLVSRYMKEEEVRAQHQISLLHLRQKALREKTKAELAWLEHQKRRLKDKGQDDKMPPLRKRQRGLIMKLQQEQAEIKRLQEANIAARRERQLLLKQQEEIERMRHTTLRLKERLKSAGDTNLGSPVAGVAEELAPPSTMATDTEMRSPSPLSVSGSETSSIMEKLKKMRFHMDEKFLTKREQQLMRRRRHAEQLLEWQQRLDAEEAEVRRMEKQALAVWEKEQQVRIKTPAQQQPRSSLESDRSKTSSRQHSPTERDVPAEGGSEDESVLSVSSVHTDLSVPEQLGSLSSDRPVSEVQPSHLNPSSAAESPHSPELHNTHSKQSPPGKVSLSHHTDSSQVAGTSGGSSKMLVQSGFKTSVPNTSGHNTSAPHSAALSETTSDQSDVESRIHALKEELRKRKSVVYQLKKEQKKRNRERLKAQEASLLKQLESYNDFIQKTTAELTKEPDRTPAAKPQIKTPTSAIEKPRMKPPALQRPETSKNWKVVTDKSEKTHKETFVHKGEVVTSDEELPTVTPTPVMGSPEHMDGLRNLHSPEFTHHEEDFPSFKEHSLRTGARDELSGDESTVCSQKSDVLEELEQVKSEVSENDQNSDPLLKLDLGLQIPPQKDADFKSEKDEDADEKPTFQSSVDAGESSKIGIGNDASLEEKSKDPDSPLAEKSPSVMDRSYTPDLLSKDSPKIQKTRSLSGDGYNDDFESSFELSLKEENHESKPTSPVTESKEKLPTYSSDEEIEEELSIRSGSTSGSFQAESQADINNFSKFPKEDISSPKCSASPQPQNPALPINDELPNFCIGDRVLVSHVQPGTLKFKGHTNFASGFWAGVELDNPEGSNNGTYDGVVYFECKENHGVFAPPDKISHLPGTIETSADTKDEDSSFDDQPNEKPRSPEEQSEDRNLLHMKGEEPRPDLQPESRGPSDENTEPFEPNLRHLSSLFVKSQHNLDLNEIDCSIVENYEKGSLIPNGRDSDIIMEFEDGSVDVAPSLNHLDKESLKNEKQEEQQTAVILDLLDESEKSRVGLQKSTNISIEEASVDTREDLKNRRALTALADKLVENFLSDAVKESWKIKRGKEEKLSAVNQLKRDFVYEDDGLRSNHFDRSAFNTRADFFNEDQQDPSSPERCNRPESPVLGTSGQEELTERLAELELSRGFLNVFMDDQVWSDEDFSLSSRKQKQRRQQQLDGISASLSLGAGEQVETPPRPELPSQMKEPEEPTMIVPHTVQEVEKLVGSATLEIWRSCKLDHGKPSLVGEPKPQPSNDFLQEDPKANDQEVQCKQSYKQAIFDLSWEVIQDIYAEDPKIDQPQWMKPRRLNSSYFHRMKSHSDINTVQDFVTAEVLKLCRLKKEQNQKTDWQKMIKFGRKKRDRVDHILVQELHEEESQWINYDEDELSVKMQLVDGIFDALLKDTVDVLTQIQERRCKRTF